MKWADPANPMTRTWRNASRILGIVTWDWYAGAASRASMNRLFAITARIGRRELHDHQWDREIPGDAISDEEWELMHKRLRTISGDQWRTYQGPTSSNFAHTCKLASDAMDKRGAWLWVDRNDLREPVIVEFSEEQQLEHINWKETFTAIEALKEAVECSESRTEITIALDNTTAVSVINAGRVPWCTQLDKELHALIQKADRTGCSIRAIFIAGISQPADEPSRGCEVNQEKTNLCADHIEQSERPWWAGINSAAKRKRE